MLIDSEPRGRRQQESGAGSEESGGRESRVTTCPLAHSPWRLPVLIVRQRLLLKLSLEVVSEGVVCLVTVGRIGLQTFANDRLHRRTHRPVLVAQSRRKLSIVDHLSEQFGCGTSI